MSDTRFKWIAGCVTVIIISVTGMFLLASKEKQEQRVETEKSDYVYIDRFGILHVDRSCSRLNYKGMQSERYESYLLKPWIFETYCPRCVSDEDYKQLKALFTMPGVSDNNQYDDNKKENKIELNRRLVYDALSEYVSNPGTFEEFNTRMEKEGNRRKAYDVLNLHYSNLGTFEDFCSRINDTPAR